MSPKYTIEDYQRAGTEIYEKLHLSTLPVGVKYIRDESEIPEGVRRPVNEGQKMSLCQCFTQSRRFSEKWAWMYKSYLDYPNVFWKSIFYKTSYHKDFLG